jgi:hypothetical protein
MPTRFAVVVAALAAASLPSCSPRTGRGPDLDKFLGEGPIAVSAVQLVQDYRTLGDGPGGADKKYRGKVLEVSGVVRSSGNDFDWEYKVTVGRIGLSGGEGVAIGVNCWFDEDAKAAASQVKQGQTVTIQGRCDGRTSDVQLRKCKLK